MRQIYRFTYAQDNVYLQIYRYTNTYRNISVYIYKYIQIYVSAQEWTNRTLVDHKRSDV